MGISPVHQLCTSSKWPSAIERSGRQVQACVEREGAQSLTLLRTCEVRTARSGALRFTERDARKRFTRSCAGPSACL